MSLPLEEGSVHEAGRALQGRELRTMKISAAATLKDLSDEYVFFNHGWLMAFGGMSLDPLQDIVNRSEKDIEPAILDFSGPVLPGGIWPWCNRVIVIERGDWDWLYDKLKSVAAIDRQTGRLVRSFPQQVLIPDQLDLDKRVVQPAVPPLVELTLFAVDASDKLVVWENGQLVRKPARPETIDLQQRLVMKVQNP
jgi:hypothetical protein